MNPAVKELWVAALESGEYEQGIGALKRDDREGKMIFCCLGVLCDLYAKEKNLEWTRTTFSNNVFRLGESSDYLPVDVMQWAGLNTHAGGFLDIAVPDSDNPGTLINVQKSLPILNDTHRVPFKDLAVAIKEQF